MKTISKYQVFSELQRGPITSVFKAIQPELQRVVLVKQLNPDLTRDEELVARLRQEGLILAKIRSPHVITIFDFGLEDGIPFLVTEFIEGQTLADLIAQHGAIPWDIGSVILHKLAQGLIAIHQHKIIHQDIKPENIFLSHDGEVKLGDLGFSVPLDQADQFIQGTPAYLAPEVIEGSAPDFRSDLYSLGVVGYEMLTGDNPFAAADMQVVLSRIANLNPLEVNAVRSQVPEQLSKMISKSMHRSPGERFASARELCQALEKFIASGGIKPDEQTLVNYLQAPDSYQISRTISEEKAEPRAAKFGTRKIPALAVASIVLLVLIIFFIRQLEDGRGFFKKNNNAFIADSTQILKQSDVERDIPEKNNEQVIPTELATKSASRDSSRLEYRGQAGDTVAGAMADDVHKSIRISSDPRSMIFQNGDSLGISPISLSVEPGRDQTEIEFRAPGFPGIKKTVNFTGEVAQKIHYNLWKEVGYLEIDVLPWGTIWIDGDSIDTSPINRQIILAPGKHELMVKHPSLKNTSELFYVAVGETVRKSIHLQKK